MSFFTAAADYIRKFFLVVRPMDFVDIIIVAYVCYKAIKLVRETRAVQLVKGLLVLVIVMQISHWLQLNTINYILRNTMQVGVVALLVVFQPELRRALEKVGRSNISNILNPADNTICYQKKWYRIGENTIENIYPPEKQHPWMDHPENKASGIIDVQRLMDILKGYEASLKAARKECEWMEKHGG